MRSITVTMWVTLDGVVQGLGRPDEDTRGGFTHGGWGPRYNDEVMGREMAKGMARPGSMLFGRRTWQDFITAWGCRTDGSPFTTHMNAATKYVVSRTMQGADAWQNSSSTSAEASHPPRAQLSHLHTPVRQGPCCSHAGHSAPPRCIGSRVGQEPDFD